MRRGVRLLRGRCILTRDDGAAEGQATDIEITAREIGKLKTELYEIISKHTGQTYDKVYSDSERDYWMKADEAKEYGMIDAVMSRKAKK